MSSSRAPAGNLHRLKCWSENFDAIAAGRKTCEVRHEDDRVFDVGDTLELTRTDRRGIPTTPQSRIVVQVTHVERVAGDLELIGVLQGGTELGGLSASLAVLSIRGPMIARAGGQ